MTMDFCTFASVGNVPGITSSCFKFLFLLSSVVLLSR